jgi:Oxysterol-binding protein
MGQNITQLDRVALPVTINEGRSYLERIADGWCFGPQFLNRAATSTVDPLERFKLVATFALSGLHNTCRPGKPFNPILGETFEGVFKDGTKLFCEQTR